MKEKAGFYKEIRLFFVGKMSGILDEKTRRSNKVPTKFYVITLAVV
jgi:hypothetical protein